jgi:hypothetical protein
MQEMRNDMHGGRRFSRTALFVAEYDYMSGPFRPQLACH